jgi:hypothetical protein
MSMEGLVHPKSGAQAFFFLDNPRLVFVQITNKLYNKKKTTVGISPHSVIS